MLVLFHFCTAILKDVEFQGKNVENHLIRPEFPPFVMNNIWLICLLIIFSHL